MEDQQQRLRDQEQLLKTRMAKVKHKIAIISGKGGVGKSLVTVNLATAFAMQHTAKVGILDADIHGPSIPKMLGMKGSRLHAGPPGVFPAQSPQGLKVVSMDFLLPSDDSPVIWRGPLKMSAIRQFLSDMVWGDLEYLFIDLPPGTGDEPLTVIQLLPEIDGVIIVTMPTEVSQNVVKKAITFARQVGAPILGVIENMSLFICPSCGAEHAIFGQGGGKIIARDMHVPLLGTIPIDPRISEDSDRGTPFIEKHHDTAAASAFMEIVKRLQATLQNQSADPG
jgi:ATP-binding protein involved in chromosome partitioning